MRYDHEIWDVMMHLFEYAERELEKKQKGTMLSEVRKLHEDAINTFTLHPDAMSWFLRYFISEECLNAPPGLDRLSDAETEATQGDIKASSTKEGKRAVVQAQKRLEEQARMGPVLVAQAKLKEAEKVRQERESAIQEAKAERDRPSLELKEAAKAEKAAEAAVKEAEEAVKKGQP